MKTKLLVGAIFMILLINNVSGQYCIPSVSIVHPDYGIVRVQLSNLDKTSANTDIYSDYTTTDTAYLTINHDDTFTITAAFEDQEIFIWIDHNKNNVFESGIEAYGPVEAFVGMPTSFEMRIPTGVPTGYTRMRVFAVAGNPCDTPFVGEAEDYTVYIQEADMEYQDATVSQDLCGLVLAPSIDNKMMKIELNTNNTLNPLIAEEIQLNTNGSSLPVDVTEAKLWYTSDVDTFNMLQQYGSTVNNPSGNFVFTDNLSLLPNQNYFWLTYSIAGNAAHENLVDANLVSVKLNNINYLPSVGTSINASKIIQYNALFDVNGNLVPNPSFEFYRCCNISNYIQKNDQKMFYTWFNPSAGTPDYYNSCYNGGSFPLAGTPTNARGHQAPRSGNAYVGVWSYNIATREYLSNHLREPLIAGAEYCIDFHINLPSEAKFITDGFGAYISNNKLDTTGAFLGMPSQINNPVNNFLSDTLNWMSIGSSYVAAGGESYITLGNFRSDTSTNTILGNGSFPATYYYLDDVSIIPVPQATINVLPNDTVCFGETISLIGISVHNEYGGYVYNWTSELSGVIGNDDTLKFTATISERFFLKISNSCGDAYDTIYIHVINNPSLTVSDDTTICINDSIIITATGAPDYIWFPDITLALINDSVARVTPIQTTTYYLTGEDIIWGCLSEDSVIVSIDELSNLDLITEDVLCTSSNIINVSAVPNAISYLWSTGDTATIIFLSDVGVYWLSVTDSFCSITDTIEIKKCNEIFIPNIFSPNGDGNNDIFRIRGNEIDNILIKIYNRWGNIVFETKSGVTPSVAEGWDGSDSYRSQKGKMLGEGVYVYYITGYFVNGNKFAKKGNITLVR